MINYILTEELSAKNKKKFRELISKYHPDKGGDLETSKRVISAKSSDKAVEDLYKELITGKKEKPKQTEKPKEKWQERFSSKEERDKWHEKVKTKREKRRQRERKKQRG